VTRSATLMASVLSLLLFAGCSSSDDDSSGGSTALGDDPGVGPDGGTPPGQNPDDRFAPLIEGQWLSSCAPADDPQAVSEQTEISITGLVYEVIESTYGDTTCTDAQRALTFRGNFFEQLFDDGQEVSDGIPVNLEFTQVTLVPFLQVVSDLYNENLLCGRDDWSPEVDMDVSDCEELLGENTVPRTDYNRYFVNDQGTPEDRSDDVVLLGTLDASPRESGRPMRVDPEVRFSRRP